MTALRPWQLSFFFHVSVVGIFLFLMKMRLPPSEFIEVPIEVEEIKEVQNLVKTSESPKVVLKSVNELGSEIKKTRDVFGVNRQSHTDESVGVREAIVAKKGNTLTKATDEEILNNSDADSLPVPTDEYLVSEMPSVLSEVRPFYPQRARDERQEGIVTMDVLIDEKGNVRQVSLIDGPEIFRPVALKAMKEFKFRPAKVEGNPVSVRIRYTLRFELEY